VGTPICPKDGTPLADSSLWVDGSLIRGKYRILRRVGVGHDEALVERFMREAVLTRRLRHPNAILVEDIDRAEDGCPFMFMEFLEG
jgi:hypothetical protein